MIQRNKTKIIATIGPATWDKEILTDLFQSGVNAVRINCSFADKEEQDRVVKSIREIAPKMPIIFDIMGHKIRVTNFTEDKILKLNQRVIFQPLYMVPEKNLLDNQTEVIEITYPNLAKELTRGSKILIDDGNIELQVDSIVDESIICFVKVPGILKKNKTLTVPNVHLSFPTLSSKDLQDIANAKALGVDFIAASFIRDSLDVKTYYNEIKNSSLKLIAKIEDDEGVKNINDIVKNVDAIMVARGDLGVEIPIEQVPQAQQKIINVCKEAGKPVIVATQMLESMRSYKTPTRAEVSDISHAVEEGADALMLSAETATGRHPIACVDMMRRIILSAENNLEPKVIYGLTGISDITDYLLMTIPQLIKQLDLSGIIVLSHSGRSVNSLSRHDLSTPIWAITSNAILAKQLNLNRGVSAYHITDFPLDRDELISNAIRLIYSFGEISLNQRLGIVGGSSIKGKGSNSILEIVIVEEVLKSK